MAYVVLPLTINEIDNGVCQAISSLWEQSVRRVKEIERREGRPPRFEGMIGVFALDSLVDNQALEQFRTRFGKNTEKVLFLNECAVTVCRELGIRIDPAAQIDDAELPSNRTLMLNIGYYR